jgi:hypothetical protein
MTIHAIITGIVIILIILDVFWTVLTDKQINIYHLIGWLVIFTGLMIDSIYWIFKLITI